MRWQELLAYCLAKPGAWQDEPWEGDVVVKVSGKIFAFFGSAPASAVGLKCGASREVADALKGRGFQYLVIDLNPHLIADLRKEGVPCIYGDAAREEVLRHASLERARGLACTVPDRRATEAIVRAARQVSSRIDVIARARDSDAVGQLQGAGAAEVVYPEFEAGLEMIRHILHRYGVGLLEIQSLLQARRSTRYQRTDDQRRGDR